MFTIDPSERSNPMTDDGTTPTPFFADGYEVSANPDGNAPPDGVSQDPADYEWAEDDDAASD